jgi:hypothetical protein
MVPPKRLLAFTAKWLLLSAIALLCVLYAGDELYFQYRIHSAKSADSFGAVDMQRVLAIELKGGKVQYTMDRQQPEQIEKCVHSLFPHAGFDACWYLVRKSRQAIPLLIFPRFRSGDLDPRTPRATTARLLTPRAPYVILRLPANYPIR